MILGHVDAAESRQAYAPQILRAIEYCRTADTDHMELGRYYLDGDDFFVIYNEWTTGKKEEKLPEVHRKYVELQYVVSGREHMGFYPDRGDNRLLQDCLEEKDTIYYQENPDSGEVMLPLVKGSYAIFFPEDVHRPFCQIDGPEKLRKIVVKINISKLNDQ